MEPLPPALHQLLADMLRNGTASPALPAEEAVVAEPSIGTSRQLRSSNLIIPLGDGTSRVFNFVKEHESTAVSYFKCMRCVNLSKREAVKYSVSVTCFDGEVDQISGSHHPKCQPISNALLEATEIDRKQRIRVMRGLMSARDAYEEGLSAAEDRGVAEHYPAWQTARSSYYKHEAAFLQKNAPQMGSRK